MAHGLWVEWRHRLRRLLDPCLNDRLEDGSLVKNPLANAGDTASVPESGRSPGGGNDNPLQYSGLGNSTDSRAWQATVRAVTMSQTWVSAHTCTLHIPLPREPPFHLLVQPFSVVTEQQKHCHSSHASWRKIQLSCENALFVWIFNGFIMVIWTNRHIKHLLAFLSKLVNLIDLMIINRTFLEFSIIFKRVWRKSLIIITFMYIKQSPSIIRQVVFVYDNYYIDLWTTRIWTAWVHFYVAFLQ